jgi:hypothetical protein
MIKLDADARLSSGQIFVAEPTQSVSLFVREKIPLLDGAEHEPARKPRSRQGTFLTKPRAAPRCLLRRPAHSSSRLPACVSAEWVERDTRTGPIPSASWPSSESPGSLSRPSSSSNSRAGPDCVW